MRPPINAGGSDVCVLINAKSPIDAGSLVDAQTMRTRVRQTHVDKTMLKSILCGLKCGNLTVLSVLVDDDLRININIRYTRYHNN